MVAGPSASWSWFPAVLERAAPSGSFVDDPFDPGDITVPFIGRPVASLLGEIDLLSPIEPAFQPVLARPSADLDDPFAWRPVHSPQAAVEQAFADAVNASEFRVVADSAELAEWSFAAVDPLESTRSLRSLDQLDGHRDGDPADLDLDDSAPDELDGDLNDGDLNDTDLGGDAGADWFDL